MMDREQSPEAAMTDLRKSLQFVRAVQCGNATDYIGNAAEIERILSVLLRVREGCDFGPLRELNDGRPDVLCLDFTGPADTLRDLDELLGGGK